MILIDSEIPKRCLDCPCCSHDDLYRCNVSKRRLGFESFRNRPDWCPLITLPPHGDLIDKDALIKQLEGLLKYSMPDSHTAQRTREMIVELGVAPTIIPAEEET